MALQLPVLRTPGQIVVNQHTKMHVEEEEGDATMCEQASALLVFPKIIISFFWKRVFPWEEKKKVFKLFSVQLKNKNFPVWRDF